VLFSIMRSSDCLSPTSDILIGKHNIFLERAMTQSSGFDAFLQVVSAARHTLHEFLGIQHPEIVPLLTYRAVIEYFAKERDFVKDVAKGALMREPHEDGHMVVQVFLDAEDKLCFKDDRRTPWGRRMAVKSLDAELTDIFGDRDVVLFN
jgi:hypothetical protein